MSVKAFCGFDLSKANDGSAFPGTNWTSFTGAYAKWAKPPYVTHGNFVSPFSPEGIPPTGANGASSWFFTRASSEGMAYGNAANGGNFDTNGYGAATSITRAAWRTAKGHQLAIVRALVLPTALTAAEYWFSMDIAFQSLGGASVGSGLSADTYGAIWRWGDLALYFKSSTWVSGTTHHIVFSVRNNGSEVATVTVNNVVTSDTFASATQLYVLVQAKLHGSTGMIAVTIDANAQSVAYTGQNTVVTTTEAAATEFYFGPPVNDSGTIVRLGSIDNFLVDDAAFPAGRPTVRIVTLASDASATGAEPGGSAPTIAAGLATAVGTFHLRFTTITGTCDINPTMPSTTGMLADVLGFELITQRVVNRYPFANLKVRVGLELSGVETEDEYAKVEPNPFSSSTASPNTEGVHHTSQIFEKTGGGGKYQTSEIASLDLRLTVQS